MNLARDEFLADARFTGNEHGQLARSDDRDVFQQALVRLAIADHLAATRPVRLPIRLRALPFGFARARERIDAFGHTHGRRRETEKRLKRSHVDVVEARGIECVECEQTPRPFVDEKRAAEAIVYFEMTVHALDQAVVRIGQIGVGGEARRFAAREDAGKTRMIADAEAPAERIARQSVDRERHEHVAIESQERGGVARKKRAQRTQKATIALGVRHLVREVFDQRNERVEQYTRSHCDYFSSLSD